MKVRTLIVDDEPHAREGIRIRLQDYPEVEVIGECGSGSEAIHTINSLNPDLLFLDIQMPEKNGFEVLRKITVEPVPFVIFVTAYDKYAVKAFEVHALDYLLKPINEVRFGDTLKLALTAVRQRGMQQYAEKLRSLAEEYIHMTDQDADDPASPTVPRSRTHIDKLMVKEKDKILLVPVRDIEWIESAGDYAYVNTATARHILRETLTSLEHQLDPATFVRIHRSTIVNIDKVVNLRPNDHGDSDVFLRSGGKLKLSRNYRDQFQAVLRPER